MHSANVVIRSCTLIDDHEQSISSISLLQEGSDMTLTATSEHLFFVKAVRDDECSTRLESVLEKMGYRLPCMSWS